jgi:hypothetical protein
MGAVWLVWSVGALFRSFIELALAILTFAFCTPVAEPRLHLSYLAAILMICAG